MLNLDGTPPAVHLRAVAFGTMMGPTVAARRGIEVVLPELQAPRGSPTNRALDFGLSCVAVSAGERDRLRASTCVQILFGDIDGFPSVCSPPLRKRQQGD